MTRPRFQFSLANLAVLIAGCALVFTRNGLADGIFGAVCVTLLFAAIQHLRRPQAFLKGFIYAGTGYLGFSQVFQTQMNPHAFLVVRSVVALTLALGFGYWCSRRSFQAQSTPSYG